MSDNDYSKFYDCNFGGLCGDKYVMDYITSIGIYAREEETQSRTATRSAVTTDNIAAMDGYDWCKSSMARLIKYGYGYNTGTKSITDTTIDWYINPPKSLCSYLVWYCCLRMVTRTYHLLINCVCYQNGEYIY